MRESIGSVFLYSIIFLFIILVMFLLTATLNYYKGYKVNKYILQSLEKYNGYNQYSKADIERILSGIGYSAENGTCPERGSDSSILTNDGSFNYCIYYYHDDRSNTEKEKQMTDKNDLPLYYNYGITTFISVKLPIVGRFKIPVFTKGERIYRFSGSCQMDNGRCL